MQSNLKNFSILKSNKMEAQRREYEKSSKKDQDISTPKTLQQI